MLQFRLFSPKYCFIRIDFQNFGKQEFNFLDKELIYDTPCPGPKLPIRNPNNPRTNEYMNIQFMPNERGAF